jgi:rod shape-determining protein MreD
MIVLLITQSVVVSRLPLLYGTADIILLVLVAWALQDKVKHAWGWTLIAGLMVSLVSAMPYFSPLIGYLLVVGIARILQRHVWQMPILAMFVATVAGTLIQNVLYYVVLQIHGTPLPLNESLSLIILPSALLNLLLSLPVYALVNDLANWVYPVEVEI